MFLGHFGVAFAAKSAAPAISLGMLFVAAQFADLLWPILVLAGVERVEIHPGITAVTPLDFIHYPYSHSLVALVAWGVALGFGYRIVRDGGWRAFWVIAALVVSHWVLDVLVHRPDMPLSLGESTKVGLGIWNSVALSVALELAMFGGCVAIYARITRAVDRVGTWAFAGLTAFFLVIYAGAVFGPPPPSVQAVAWSGIGMWILVAWAYWVDKHRVARA
jgi:hypothetical protein